MVLTRNLFMQTKEEETMQLCFGGSSVNNIVYSKGRRKPQLEMTILSLHLTHSNSHGKEGPLVEDI